MPFEVKTARTSVNSQLVTVLRAASAEELTEYEKYKSQNRKENTQNSDFALVKSFVDEIETSANIGNVDTKVIPERSAVQNKLSKRDFIIK